MVGWPAHHLGLDAVDRDARLRQAALRVDQLLEGFLAQQLAVDDARRADLDDLVAGARLQARGLGVEHGVAQLGQAAVVQRMLALAGAEEVEVVVLGAAVVAHGSGVQRVHVARRVGQRQQDSGRRPGGARGRARTRTRRRGAAPRRARSAGWPRRRSASGSLSQLITVSVLIAWPDQIRSSCARPPAGCRRSVTARTSNSSTSRPAR